MAVFLLEYRKDEERQADFSGKEATSPILETMASFTNSIYHLNANLMVNNNTIIVFL